MHSPEAVPKGQRDCTGVLDNGNNYEACNFLCYRASALEERDMKRGRSICVVIDGRTLEDSLMLYNYILLFLLFK